MKAYQILRCIFPEVLSDYFDIVDYKESSSRLDFWLDERNYQTKEDYKRGTVSSGQS